MTETKKKTPFAIDRESRRARRSENRLRERTHKVKAGEISTTTETSIERAEHLALVQEMAKNFVASNDKSEGDQTISPNELRRREIENLHPEKITWQHFAAVAERDMKDVLPIWAKICEAADDELESGRRAARVAGYNTNPYAMAQFLAIRNAFADEWQPRGGIESALIDILAWTFSLQMYWTEIAHERAIKAHNKQTAEIEALESSGWKSPYQYEADAIEQANRLADNYNRQFVRVLRQLRDLRRYAPVVIQNNGGQVNVGSQQVNVQKTD